MKIGEALKKERKSHFLLQKDMVKDLNISKSHYSQIESGKHRVYTDDLLKMLISNDIDYRTFFDEVVTSYGFDEIRSRLETALTKAFYERNLDNAVKIKKEIMMSNQVSVELKYHAFLVVAEISNTQISDSIKKEIQNFLFKDDNWTEHRDALRLFGNAMKYFDPEARSVLMNSVLKKYKNINTFSKVTQIRILTIYINYLFNHKGRIDKTIKDIIQEIKLVDPQPQYLIYKLLGTYFELKYQGDESSAELIKTTLSLAGYNKIVKQL